MRATSVKSVRFILTSTLLIFIKHKREKFGINFSIRLFSNGMPTSSFLSWHKLKLNLTFRYRYRWLCRPTLYERRILHGYGGRLFVQVFHGVHRTELREQDRHGSVPHAHSTHYYRQDLGSLPRINAKPKNPLTLKTTFFKLAYHWRQLMENGIIGINNAINAISKMKIPTCPNCFIINQESNACMILFHVLEGESKCCDFDNGLCDGFRSVFTEYPGYVEWQNTVMPGGQLDKNICLILTIVRWGLIASHKFSVAEQHFSVSFYLYSQKSWSFLLSVYMWSQ